MLNLTGIKVDAYIPLIRKAGERPPLENWTRWHFEVARLTGELHGSEEPVMTRTQWHLKIEWIVRDEQQLRIVLSFFERTRRDLGLDELSSQPLRRHFRFLRMKVAKTHGPDPKALPETQRAFYRDAVRLYRKGVDWFEFWNFAFGFGSPLYDGVRVRSDVLGTPLETSLRSMWLDLGVQQGMVQPEKPKRAARRK